MKRQPPPKDAPFTSYIHRAGAYTVRDHVPYRLPRTGNLQLSPQPSRNLKRLLSTFTRLTTAQCSDTRGTQNLYSEVDVPEGRSFAASRSDLTDLNDGESACSRWSLFDNSDPHRDQWAIDERHSAKAQSPECDTNHVKLQQALNGQNVDSVAKNADAIQANPVGYTNGNLANSADAPAQTTVGKVFEQSNTSNRRYAASAVRESYGANHSSIQYKSCDSLTLSEISSADVFERRLRLIREQNSSLCRRNDEAERVYKNLLNESNQKYAQVKRLCETLQTLVSSYESLVSEQSIEIEQLKALLSEESKALERTRKEWQLYEITNRSLEERLNSLQVALDRERKQIQHLKRGRSEDNRPSSKASVNLTTVSVSSQTTLNLDSVDKLCGLQTTLDEWKQKYDSESSRSLKLEAKLRDCVGKFENVNRFIKEREGRQTRFLTSFVFRQAPIKANVPVSISLSDQLDALTSYDCIRRVSMQFASSSARENGEKRLVLDGFNELCETDDVRLTGIAGLLFSAKRRTEKTYVKVHRSVRPMNFPFLVNGAGGNERKLHRTLHSSFLLLKGISSVALRRTPVSFDLDEDVGDRPVMRRKQHRVQQARPAKATVTAYSAETDHAKRRRALKMRSQNSIDEEWCDRLDDEEASNSVSSLRQSSESTTAVADKVATCDAQTDTLDMIPSVSHVAINCDELDEQFDDPDVKKERRFDEENLYAMESSLPECEDETDNDEANMEARSLLCDIESMQTFEHVLAELLGQPEAVIENRFSVASARFHLDRSTLKKRAEICDRQHKLAEKHMEQCLNETFKGLVKIQEGLMSERSLSRNGQPCSACEMCVKLYGELRKSFNRTEKCIFRFTSRAEQLGALQEELRTSNACEVMTACFESLKHTHGLVVKELEEAKKQIEIFEIDYKQSMEARRASEQGEESLIFRKPRIRRTRPRDPPHSLHATASAWTTLRDSFSAVTRFGSIKRAQTIELSTEPTPQANDQPDQTDSDDAKVEDEDTVELQDQAVQCDLFASTLVPPTEDNNNGQQLGLKHSDSNRIYGITVAAFATLLFAVIYHSVIR